jgi:hypothetical protein
MNNNLQTLDKLVAEREAAVQNAHKKFETESKVIVAALSRDYVTAIRAAHDIYEKIPLENRSAIFADGNLKHALKIMGLRSNHRTPNTARGKKSDSVLATHEQVLDFLKSNGPTLQSKIDEHFQSTTKHGTINGRLYKLKKDGKVTVSKNGSGNNIWAAK